MRQTPPGQPVFRLGIAPRAGYDWPLRGGARAAAPGRVRRGRFTKGRFRMKSPSFVSAGVLAALSGHAAAQPVIDGSRDNAFYGTTPLWVQSQPTGFGDNLPSNPCDNSQIGNPGAVT